LTRWFSIAAALVLLASGCGSAPPSHDGASIPPELLREARPIGRGPRFHPPARGPILGACEKRLGSRYGAHVEVFAQNRVVIVASGIGTRPPRSYSAGRISRAACYGELVTLEPTGVVLIRPGARVTLSDLFRTWGQPLSPTRLASFAAPRGRRVAVFIGGRRWSGDPTRARLTRHAEIVLEVGPYVPPHRSYTFPPGT